jgi:hypothetical protein
MMGRICVGLSLPLLLGAGPSEVPEGWKTVESKGAGFKAIMPAEPMLRTQQVKTATGQLRVTLFVAEGKNDAVFAVSYTDYPEMDLKKGPIEKRLDQARDGAVASAGGKLRSERAIKLQGHSGRELVVEKNGEAVARMRIYLVKRRLYQVMVLGPAPAKDAETFLASFDLSE